MVPKVAEAHVGNTRSLDGRRAAAERLTLERGSIGGQVGKVKPCVQIITKSAARPQQNRQGKR
jgi:hypothetical protein